jgi:hypothetical protein
MGGIGPAGLLFAVVVSLVIMLLIRALWLWYWKVNEIVRLLTEISDHLRHMDPNRSGPPREAPE